VRKERGANSFPLGVSIPSMDTEGLAPPALGATMRVKRGDTGIGLSTGFQLPFISLGLVSEAKVPAGRTLVSALAG
jgi:hypothetical protein